MRRIKLLRTSGETSYLGVCRSSFVTQMRVNMECKTFLGILIILSFNRVLGEVLTSEETAAMKVRHKKPLLQTNKGKYTTKEEIQKAPSEDHPCRLTRTSVEITFPDMKSETFVNFLGYKEPNLMHLMRCKGKCGGNSVSDQIGCTPTKVRQKKVKMIVKTQLTGRDPREKVKDMILEEHVECGCQCKHISSLSCLGRFNNATCECECEEKHYGQERLRCELLKNTYWDSKSCQCRSKSVAPRGVEEFPNGDCANGGGVVDPYQLMNTPISSSSSPTKLEIISLVLLGSFLTVSIFLAASTFYYRNKVAILVNKKPRKENVKESEPPKPKPKKVNIQSKLMKQQSVAAAEFSPIMNDVGVLEDIMRMTNTCDRYDQHGVKIEQDFSDQELLQHTFR